MKKFVNFRFVVTLVLAIFANVATYAQDNVVDEVVWVVGDEAILKSDVEEARMDALYNGRRFEGNPYCVIPEEIAVQKLFLHQAKLDSIEVSEAEIIQRVDMMTNMYIQQIGSREKMEEYFNKTSTQIRETLRDNARDGLDRPEDAAETGRRNQSDSGRSTPLLQRPSAGQLSLTFRHRWKCRSLLCNPKYPSRRSRM